MTELEKMTELFRKLGADDPESWARSQVEEGINQLGRFLFLRGAWQGVIEEEDSAWIEQEISYSEQYPDAPCAGSGQALKRLLTKGADPSDLTELVRTMQFNTLAHICQVIDDAGCVNQEPEVQDNYWSLVQINGDEEDGKLIQALHESTLELDSTGREMRPRQQGGS